MSKADPYSSSTTANGNFEPSQSLFLLNHWLEGETVKNKTCWIYDQQKASNKKSFLVICKSVYRRDYENVICAGSLSTLKLGQHHYYSIFPLLGGPWNVFQVSLSQADTNPELFSSPRISCSSSLTGLKDGLRGRMGGTGYCQTSTQANKLLEVWQEQHSKVQILTQFSWIYLSSQLPWSIPHCLFEFCLPAPTCWEYLNISSLILGIKALGSSLKHGNPKISEAKRKKILSD